MTEDIASSFCCKEAPQWLKIMLQHNTPCCMRLPGHDGHCVGHLKDVTFSWPNPVQAFGANIDFTRPLPPQEGVGHGG